MDYTFNEEMRVPFDKAKAWTKAIFMAHGMNDPDADVMADHLVVADARGIYSHGIMRVPIYCRRLVDGGTSATAQPVVLKRNKASALVDGKNAMGMVVSKYAMELAIEMAKDAGSAAVAVMGSNHLGACGYWTEIAANANMIGLCWSMACVNMMAPWGGIQPMLGNNLFAIAASCKTRPNFVLDMATTVVARGKLVMAMKTGHPIPETWALDTEGKPTTDPEKGYWGTMRPVGDHKGYGLTLMNAIMSSMLPGAFFGDAVTDLYERPADIQNTGHLFQAIDIASITDVDAFKQRMDDAFTYLKGGEKAAGVDEIFVPGEMEANLMAKQMKEGVSYPTEVIEELRTLSKQVGIEPYV
jgi:LDH2 family malate/lactate/ureidoglycolate dehydrogenase